MGKFAKIVGKAVRGNAEFRKIIKDEALALFDGDYDILVKTVGTKTIQPSDPVILTRSGGTEITIKNLLDYYAEEVDTRSGNSSIIEELQETYPNLQITVPVHAEEWNPEVYTPVIAFS